MKCVFITAIYIVISFFWSIWVYLSGSLPLLIVWFCMFFVILWQIHTNSLSGIPGIGLSFSAEWDGI